jgi:hypothetical protein
MSTSKAVVTISTTEAVTTKKRKRGPAVSTDMATAITKTEAVVGEEDDTRSTRRPSR